MSPKLVTAAPDMAEPVSRLVHASFSELAAGDWEPSASERLLSETSPEEMAALLEAPAFAAAEVWAEQFVGFILMPRPALLSMLFVHPQHLRQGVARRLWEAARAHIEVAFPEVKTVELNATPYAFNAYRALGFFPISNQFTRRGCKITRMACWLPARGLGADAL
jgi:GNAT superfamily N-acetyltransferase